jgi:hypothetical protein
MPGIIAKLRELSPFWRDEVSGGKAFNPAYA